jgi:uncharacterized protein (DUF885 family)
MTDTAVSGATAQLAELSEQFLHDYFAFYPTTASSLGLHEYDGYIVDLSTHAIAAYLDLLRTYQHRLSQIELSGLDRLAVFDYALLRWKIEAELWSWTEDCEHKRNPMIYSYNAMVDTYVQRDYAPLAERAASLTRHLQQIPQAMDVARQNLEPRVPRILIEEALTIFAGLVTFLNDSLPDAMRNLEDPVLAQDLWQARDRAVAAINDFQSYLRTTMLPRSHDQFAIGAEQFASMLRHHELIDIPLDRLLAIGEADLARNQEALVQIAAERDPARGVHEQMQEMGRNHPPIERLLSETRALLDDLRTFLRERDLVSLPAEGHCHVEETPPFARWAFAMMDTAGPFEQTATDSFYYITLPEEHWSPDEVEGWLTKFDYATLTDVSIHEAYPGHYVHFSQARHAPTRLSKVFATYSHYESWAHYVEQMMLDQGYGNNDPHLRMAQLAEALVRNCRYVCAIRMHTRGMTIEEATSFFVEHAYMDEVTARKEARRGAHDPGYLNYTLGKLLLLKLLEEYQAAAGDAFSLKQFHDEYISYGSPPIPILRSMLLPNTNGALL